MRPLSLGLLVGAGWILQQLPLNAYGEGNLTEEVVVTGTRTEQSVWDSPVKVSLVNREAIQKSHAKNAAEAIENMPGLHINRTTGKKGKEVWIQGVSADRVLVLINGNPVSPSTGSSVDLTQISTSQIERIEVVKGATSALYGSAGIGGAVNIITSKPEEGVTARLSVDAGSWGDRDDKEGYYYVPNQRYDGLLSYANSDFAIKAGVSASLSNGYMSNLDHWDQPVNSGEQATSFISGTWYQSESLDHTLVYEYYFQEYENRYTDTKGANSFYLYRTDDADRHTVRYDGGYNNEAFELIWGAMHEDFTNKSIPKPGQFRQADITYSQIDLQLNHELGLHTFTHGIDFKEHTLSAVKDDVDELPSNKPFRSFEYYFQDQLIIGDLQLLPGFRYQKDNFFGNQFMPKINGRYDFVDDGDQVIFLRAGIGKGYRVPGLKELFFLLDHSSFATTRYIVLGNEDLRPESSINYQIEWGVISSSNYKASFNLFYNDLTDLINEEYSGESEGGVLVYSYNNIDKARIQGAELNLEVEILSWASLTSGYSYVDAQDLSKERRLPFRPRHQLKSSIDLDLTENLNFLLSVKHYSDQLSYDDNAKKIYKTTNYTILDTKANYQLNEFLSVYGGVDNLTDVTADFTDDFDRKPTDGRYYYLGFTLEY